MLLGLVTDVHNQAANLARALDLFRAHGVQQVVTIGDTCDAFAPPDGAAEVANLLMGCGAIGVWGNHDFALCRDVSQPHRARHPAVVLDFMARMQPRLEVAGCHFSHMEASVDPHDPLQLWAVSEELDLGERAGRGFATVPHPRQFVGHYHRWWAATPQGRLEWAGPGPLLLAPGQRHFVVVAAVFDGWCAVFDSETGLLQPLRCDQG